MSLSDIVASSFVGASLGLLIYAVVGKDTAEDATTSAATYAAVGAAAGATAAIGISVYTAENDLKYLEYNLYD